LAMSSLVAAVAAGGGGGVPLMLSSERSGHDKSRSRQNLVDEILTWT
jgi:hypothetical protein